MTLRLNVNNVSCLESTSLHTGKYFLLDCRVNLCLVKENEGGVKIKNKNYTGYHHQECSPDLFFNNKVIQIQVLGALINIL